LWSPTHHQAPASRITWRSMGRSEPWGWLEVGWVWSPAPRCPGEVPPSPLCLSSRYCGERSQFVVTSNSSKMTVRFHSDHSYTDTGFLAEYLSYDSKNREWALWEDGLALDALSVLYLTSSVLPATKELENEPGASGT
jgi:hypothetical protein